MLPSYYRQSYGGPSSSLGRHINRAIGPRETVFATKARSSGELRYGFRHAIDTLPLGTNPSGCPKPVEAGRTRRQHTIRHYEGMIVSPDGRYLSTSASAALWGQPFNEGGGVGPARLTVIRYECMTVMRFRRPGSARSLSLPRPPRESASPGGARLPGSWVQAPSHNQRRPHPLRAQKRAPPRRRRP